MDHNTKIFKGKSLTDLLSEIYDNSRKKEKKINELIAQIVPMMVNKGDVVVLAPILKGHIEMGIKNDEHLIKMAGIIQKAISETKEGEEATLDEKEIESLYKEAKNINIKIIKQVE